METWIVLAVAVLPSLTAGIVGWLVQRKVNEVHLSVNSRLDLLLQTASALARAEGLAEGRAEKDQKP